MAKKQEKATETAAQEKPAQAEGEANKKKEPKARPPREPKEARAKDAQPDAADEAKPKEGKGKEGKAREAKAKPDVAAAAPSTQGAATPEKSAPAAGAAPTGKKGKGKQPGKSPALGKQLRELQQNIQQRLAKEGSMPLARAVAVLREIYQQRRDLKKKAGKQKGGFDETVEIHMNLGVDTSQSDQMVRGSVPLPHGVGKTVRVVVFCQGDNVAKAKAAGASEVGSDELIKKVQGGWMDFDVALATQDMMGQVSRLGKVLGPRGLMPTPKAGTVITANADVTAAVREFRAGKVEYRSDKSGNVHAGIGKMSFEDNKLVDNATAFVDQVRAAKPTGVKGHYIRSITLSSTMSPSVAVAI
jgi:large subunit ribosomal protein L1